MKKAMRNTSGGGGRLSGWARPVRALLVTVALAVALGPGPGLADARPTVGELIDHFVAKHCGTYRVDPDLVLAIMEQESDYRPTALGPPTRHGRAKGLMQLIPATARRFAVENPYSIDENIRGGVQYLRTLLDQFDGNIPRVVAAYYSGEHYVARTGGRVKREVYEYARQVGQRYQRLKRRPGLAPRVRPAANKP